MEHKMKRTVKMALVLGVMSALGLSACETGPVEETSTANLVWPEAPEQPRIKYLTSWSTSEFAENENQLLKSLLGESNEVSGLRKPYGVHADKSGRVFVTDTELGKLVVFDEANGRFDIWGESGKGVLIGPIGVASDDEGHIYVTDSGQSRVVVFDAEGEYVRAFGGKDDLEAPTGIAVSNKLGRVFVSDARRHNIAVFDLEGNAVATIGKRGIEPGEFNFPTNLTIDNDDRLYVTDTMNFRIQILEADGTFVSEFGGAGDGFGKFSRPKGVAVDSDRNIYVVDAAFGNFQIFDQDGNILLFVGEAGINPGQFILPAGAYIDGQDRLYVVDQLNQRVQVFQILIGSHVDESGSQTDLTSEDG